MKKTSAQFKPDTQSAKLIESLRQSYKNKDIIQKSNNYDNSNRGLSETKISYSKPNNQSGKQYKKSEEPISRITEDNLRNKSKERQDHENSNSNNVIKINVFYNNKGVKGSENSNRSPENNKLNIVGGLIINANNNINISPKEALNKIPTTNYSKFANNTKHVKAKSISSNRGILTSLNLLKNKKTENKSKNDSSYNNISFENTKENIVISNNKSSNIVFLDNNGNITDHQTRGHVRNNSSNINFNNNLNHSFNNMNNVTNSNVKSTNKISTASSITKIVPNNQTVKLNEIDSPEELQYFYVNLFKQNKNLAYRFENLNFSDEEFHENCEI